MNICLHAREKGINLNQKSFIQWFSVGLKGVPHVLSPLCSPGILSKILECPCHLNQVYPVSLTVSCTLKPVVCGLFIVEAAEMSSGDSDPSGKHAALHRTVLSFSTFLTLYLHSSFHPHLEKKDFLFLCSIPLDPTSFYLWHCPCGLTDNLLPLQIHLNNRKPSSSPCFFPCALTWQVDSWEFLICILGVPWRSVGLGRGLRV